MKKFYCSNDELNEIIESNGIDLIVNKDMEIIISDEDAEHIKAIAEKFAPAASGDYAFEDIPEPTYQIEIYMDPYHAARISHANDIILEYYGANPVRWTRDDLRFSSFAEAKDELASILRSIYESHCEILDHFSSREELVKDLVEGFDLDEAKAETAASFFSVPGYYDGENLIMADTDTSFTYDIYGYSINKISE